jgi:hypothetical protein
MSIQAKLGHAGRNAADFAQSLQTRHVVGNASHDDNAPEISLTTSIAAQSTLAPAVVQRFRGNETPAQALANQTQQLSREVPRPSLDLAMPMPLAPSEGDVREQKLEDVSADLDDGPEQTSVDVRAVTDRVYELMKREVRLSRERGAPAWKGMRRY